MPLQSQTPVLEQHAKQAITQQTAMKQTCCLNGTNHQETQLYYNTHHLNKQSNKIIIYS